MLAARAIITIDPRRQRGRNGVLIRMMEEVMSEYGFTPGPWEFIVERGYDAYVIPKGSTEDAICRINGDAKHPEIHANARLISAAPDLLEAGQRLIDVFNQQKMTNAERIIAGISDAGLRTEGNAAMEALSAAIAKAVGRG